MKTLLFISIVLISGACAGLLHGGVNLVIVEPYLDVAIGIENQKLLRSNDIDDDNSNNNDTEEFWNSYYSYRAWQKSGQVLAGVILGVAVGSLFGIVFALARPILPGNHNIKKAVILAAIMWLVIFFIPFLKYPANPPTVGDVNTIEFRTILYISFITISGLGSVSWYQIAKRFKKNKKSVAVGGYASLMIIAFILMPQNPDQITVSTDLIDGFRLASILGVGTFWISMPLILGALWQRFKPDAFETFPGDYNHNNNNDNNM